MHNAAEIFKHKIRMFLWSNMFAYYYIILKYLPAMTNRCHEEAEYHYNYYKTKLVL